jgi:hypothetical protein
VRVVGGAAGHAEPVQVGDDHGLQLGLEPTAERLAVLVGPVHDGGHDLDQALAGEEVVISVLRELGVLESGHEQLDVPADPPSRRQGRTTTAECGYGIWPRRVCTPSGQRHRQVRAAAGSG